VLLLAAGLAVFDRYRSVVLPLSEVGIKQQGLPRPFDFKGPLLFTGVMLAVPYGFWAILQGAFESYLHAGLAAVDAVVLWLLIANGIRRSRAVGLSPFWLFAALFPILGSVIWLVLGVLSDRVDSADSSSGNRFFSFQGTVSRRSYIAVQVVAAISLIWLKSQVSYFEANRGSLTLSNSLPLGLASVTLAIILFAATMRRSRDAGHSPALAWLLLIPMVNFGLSIYLMIAKSQEVKKS
jgi:uncharacterized membrane protein YhaH (DUF805 family)